VRREQISITGEANHIIGRARNHDARVVTLGPLVFFSTETGDAWMLDPKDSLAICLVQGGEAQPFTITETATDWKVPVEAECLWSGRISLVHCSVVRYNKVVTDSLSVKRMEARA